VTGERFRKSKDRAVQSDNVPISRQCIYINRVRESKKREDGEHSMCFLQAKGWVFPEAGNKLDGSECEKGGSKGGRGREKKRGKKKMPTMKKIHEKPIFYGGRGCVSTLACLSKAGGGGFWRNLKKVGIQKRNPRSQTGCRRNTLRKGDNRTGG